MIFQNRVLTCAGAVLVAAAALTACGGGGGGGGVTPPSGGGPTPCPSGWTGTAPSCVAPTSTPSTTTANGTVVDDASNSPLSGVQVALQPWVENASPSPVATTNAQGQFSFTAANGHYLLIIGSNSASDTRATVHDNVTLKGGSQPLVAPTEWPMPTITPKPSELSGAYRLMTLDTTIQTPCLSAVNAARANLSLAALVPDEWLEENSFYANQAQNNQNLTTFPGGLATGSEDQDNGATSCNEWIQSLISGKTGTWSGYGMLSSPYALWYGGAFYNSGSWQHNVGWEEWGYDPTIDTPCPSPPPSPQPTPGPGGCDPVYQVWP